jgi:hypothetical protein
LTEKLIPSTAFLSPYDFCKSVTSKITSAIED